jgi:hypothetical protein
MHSEHVFRAGSLFKSVCCTLGQNTVYSLWKNANSLIAIEKRHFYEF